MGFGSRQSTVVSMIICDTAKDKWRELKLSFEASFNYEGQNPRKNNSYMWKNIGQIFSSLKSEE